MHIPGRGILAIWHDLATGCEEDFLLWHTCEHMPERLSVPGFLHGCRYEVMTGSPRVFNFYLTAKPEILTSDAYLARLNDPTPWTARVVPTLRNVNRSAGRVVASCGRGQGGVIVTLRVSPANEKQDDLKDWLEKTALPRMVEQPGMIAAHLWQADAAASGVKTAESRARGNTTAVSDWTVAIEGNDVGYVQSARDWLEQQQEFAELLRKEPNVGVYRLQHRLDA